MCADDRSVDDRACVVDLVLQLTEDRGPVSLPRPVREAVVDRLPRAKSLRQVTPRRAGLGSIEHGLDEESVSAYRRRARALSRQHALKPTPLLFRECVSVHRDF